MLNIITSFEYVDGIGLNLMWTIGGVAPLNCSSNANIATIYSKITLNFSEDIVNWVIKISEQKQ